MKMQKLMDWMDFFELDWILRGFGWYHGTRRWAPWSPCGLATTGTWRASSLAALCTPENPPKKQQFVNLSSDLKIFVALLPRKFDCSLQEATVVFYIWILILILYPSSYEFTFRKSLRSNKDLKYFFLLQLCTYNLCMNFENVLYTYTYSQCKYNYYTWSNLNHLWNSKKNLMNDLNVPLRLR